MKTILLAAVLLGGTALPAFAAGIRCDMTDQQHNMLTYSFGRGGHGYATEVAVWRNGTLVSNGGPSWSRVTDEPSKTITLWQGEWSLAYTWDADRGFASVLRHNNNEVATGNCVVDRTINDTVVASNPAPAPILDNNLSPTYSPPTTSPLVPAYGDNQPPASSNDLPPAPPSNSSWSVPIILAHHSVYVAVNVGGLAETMLIDTGCTDMTVSDSVATDLIQRGEADWLPDSTAILAGGLKQRTHNVLIHRVSIGGHTVTDVHAGVTPDNTDQLLGLAVLGPLGKFTIDTQNNLLTFS